MTVRRQRPEQQRRIRGVFLIRPTLDETLRLDADAIRDRWVPAGMPVVVDLTGVADWTTDAAHHLAGLAAYGSQLQFELNTRAGAQLVETVERMAREIAAAEDAIR